MNKKIITKLFLAVLICTTITTSHNQFSTYAQQTINRSAIAKSKVSQTGTTTGSVNMRRGASTSHKIVTKLKKGTKVDVLKKMSNGWYQVKYNGKIGYISGKYLKLTTKLSSTKVNKKGTTTGSVNMRSGASTSYKIVTKLKKGVKIDVLKKMSNGWYQIKYNGKTGYISGKYLKLTTQSSNNNDGNINLNKNGIITNSVNMRSGPSTSYKIVTKLKRNDKVEVIYETSNKYFKWKDGWYELKNNLYTPVSPSLDKIKSNTWCKIRYNGKEGYINSKYISITKGKVSGLSFSGMKSKMNNLGFEKINALGYNYGFRNQHLSEIYNIFDSYIKTDKSGFYIEIRDFTNESRKPLKNCLDLLLPNKSNEVYNVVKELATKNGMRDNYRRLYMDGRSIAIHKYTGSSTFVVIEN